MSAQKYLRAAKGKLESNFAAAVTTAEGLDFEQATAVESEYSVPSLTEGKLGVNLPGMPLHFDRFHLSLVQGDSSLKSLQL